MDITVDKDVHYNLFTIQHDTLREAEEQRSRSWTRPTTVQPQTRRKRKRKRKRRRTKRTNQQQHHPPQARPKPRPNKTEQVHCQKVRTILSTNTTGVFARRTVVRRATCVAWTFK